MASTCLLPLAIKFSFGTKEVSFEKYIKLSLSIKPDIGSRADFAEIHKNKKMLIVNKGNTKYPKSGKKQVKTKG